MLQREGQTIYTKLKSDLFYSLDVVYLGYILAIAYMILLGNTEGKRTLGRPRSRREDNIKINLR
jgi:hypothetical protein